MMRYFYLLLFALIAGCSSTANKPIVENLSSTIGLGMDTNIYVLAEWGSNINFFGYVDKVAPGSSRNVFYTTDAGVVGLLAQVLTHGAVSSSMQKNKAKARQESANKVLQNYWPVIDKIDNHLLYAFANTSKVGENFHLHKMEPDLPVLSNDVVIRLSPQYYLSADQRSMMFVMRLTAYRTQQLEHIFFQRAVKSISAGINSENPQAIWLEGSPSYFEKTAKALFAEGLNSLLEDLLLSTKIESNEQKTFSYDFGTRKYYERASLIKESCHRTYIRNLKSDVMIIPNDIFCNRMKSKIEKRDALAAYK